MSDGHRYHSHLQHGSDEPESPSNASESSFTRISFASTTVTQKDQFAGVAAAARGEDRWAEYKQECRRTVCTVKGAYVFTGIFGCICTCCFALASMVVDDKCSVFYPHGRCCSCPVVNETRLVGQEIPMQDDYNGIFYASLIILNAIIGLIFVVESVSKENKYQLICAMIAKIVGCIREGADIVLETRHISQTVTDARIVLVVLSGICTCVMAALIPRLFSQFGWRIFRRSGGNMQQRAVYLLYQQVRGLNWLESQASIILHITFVMWLRYAREQFWTWMCLTALEVISSRQAIHHLKRENTMGCVVALFSKVFCLAYAIIVSQLYANCRNRFDESLAQSTIYWKMDPYPNLVSVRETYNGVHCLPDHTAHDDRTLEIMIISLSLLCVFRVAFIISFVRVMRHFGDGLASLFYKVHRRGGGGGGKRSSRLTAGTGSSSAGGSDGRGDKDDQRGRASAGDGANTDNIVEAWVSGQRGDTASDVDDQQSMATHKSVAASSSESAQKKGVTVAEQRRLAAAFQNFSSDSIDHHSSVSRNVSTRSVGGGVYGKVKPEEAEEVSVADFTADGGAW